MTQLCQTVMRHNRTIKSLNNLLYIKVEYHANHNENPQKKVLKKITCVGRRSMYPIMKKTLYQARFIFKMLFSF